MLSSLSISQSTMGNAETLVEVTTGQNDKAIVVVFVKNTDSVARTVYLHAGTTPAAANAIVEAEIDPGDTFILNAEKCILSEGEKLMVYGSATGVLSATVSYVEI